MHLLSQLSASDMLAISMLAVMVLTFTAVASLILVMLYHVNKREKEDIQLEELLAEIAEEEKREQFPKRVRETSEKDLQQPWEKEAEWWKLEL